MMVEDYFRHASHEGLEERLRTCTRIRHAREQQRPRYRGAPGVRDGTILKMGFPGYFLIVGDFINWAKHNGCPVGPGRGSGAGSLVAYALKITDLDPLQYNLLFERFLNPERVSMPDFDIDFCQANRDRVIDYVKEIRQGRGEPDRHLRHHGRARGHPRRGPRAGHELHLLRRHQQADPEQAGHAHHHRRRDQGRAGAGRALAKEEDVKTLLALAQKLEGMTRNVGMHAGGVLIAPGKLTDFCPLYQQPGSESAVSQYDKDDVEAIGLVKFDFLGLATLTILEIAREFIVGATRARRTLLREPAAGRRHLQAVCRRPDRSGVPV
jgi:DNA polymerase-3 subunit alpha